MRITELAEQLDVPVFVLRKMVRDEDASTLLRLAVIAAEIGDMADEWEARDRIAQWELA